MHGENQIANRSERALKKENGDLTENIGEIIIDPVSPMGAIP
jgi:hypothetical protein